jgi:hypothetical protein
MSDFTIDLDMNTLSRQMERYVRELGQDGPTVVKTQARLLLQTLIRITPPHSLKEGRAAVARDVRRALGLIDERKIKVPWIATALKDGEIQVVNAWLKNLPSSSPLRGFTARAYGKELHTGQRNTRGHVRRSQHIIALPPSAARKRLRDVQKRVGQAKGAFMPAYHLVGGSAAGWIERRGKYGGVTDVDLKPGPDPRLTIINNARGMRSLDERAVSRTIMIREEAMGKHIAKQHEIRARENNLA